MPTFQMTVGPDRTVRLPEDICDRLGIEDGSKVELFLTLDGQVHFHAITQTASGLGGFFIDRLRPPLSIREMDDGIAEHLAEKHVRSSSERDEDQSIDARSAAE